MGMRTTVDTFTLYPSTAITATGTGDTVYGMGGYAAIWFEMDLTAAATDTGDTLDVYVQTQSGSGNWVDIVHFTQALGDGGAKRFFAKVAASAAEALFANGTSLDAGSVRHLLGERYRVRWAITDADSDCSFTFSVTANAIGD